jgi:hypothetical protein
MPTSGTWTPYKDGKSLRLASVLDRLGAWIEPMQHFIAAISEYDTRSG